MRGHQAAKPAVRISRAGGHQAGKPTDRISRAVILLAGVSCGAIAITIGVPLAQSSPYPAARETRWATSSAPSYQPASASSVATERSLTAVERLAAIEWEALTSPILTPESFALVAKSIPEPIWDFDSDAPKTTASAAAPVRLASIAPTSLPTQAPVTKVVAPTKLTKAAAKKSAVEPDESASTAADDEAAPAKVISTAGMQFASISPNISVSATPTAKAVVAPS